MNMLRALMDKIDDMEEQIANVNTEMGILRIKKKRIELKNMVAEMKNVFDGLIGRPDIAEERISRISEFEDVTVETAKK